MRIVVDANILVSGVFWAGAPKQVLELWMKGRIELLASTEIVAEYDRVLHEIADERGRPDLAHQWSKLLAQYMTLLDIVPRLNACRDPDDNKYLDCAVQSGADMLVSGDKDLLSLGTVDGIPICSARQMIAAVG